MNSSAYCLVTGKTLSIRDAIAPGGTKKECKTGKRDRIERVYSYICKHPGCSTKQLSVGVPCAKMALLYDALEVLRQENRVYARRTIVAPGTGAVGGYNIYFPSNVDEQIDYIINERQHKGHTP